MAYTTNHLELGAIGDVLPAATAVATDPCLGQVATLVRRLHDLEQPRRTASGAPVAPAPPTKGIGLCQAVTPLRAVVYIKERPWILPVGAICLIGGLMGLGYVLGATRKR
jgi:hypothetical protein